MLIHSCFQCKFHEARQGEEEETSYCRRENCWSHFSRCVAKTALDHFLDEERSGHLRSFSALSHVYPTE